MSRTAIFLAIVGLSAASANDALAKPKFVVQPVQVGNETVRFEQGEATVELYSERGSVQIQPLPTDHGSLAFYVGIFNAGDQPANIDITNFTVRAGSQPLPVFSRQELEKKAKNRAMWTQIGLVAVGGLAAAGAASQRDTYRSTLYTPRGVYRGYYSAPSTAGQIQAAAITAGTGYAVYKVQEQLDRTRQELANSVVQLTTVDPGESYGGKIVVAKIKDKKLPKEVTVELNWNGEIYPFHFRLAKPGTPQPVFTNKLPLAAAPVAPEIAAAETDVTDNAASLTPAIIEAAAPLPDVVTKVDNPKG